MKKNDIVKVLMPGVIVGLILGFALTFVVGIDKENPIPNYIGGAMCCFVPTLLNCIIVLKSTAKILKRDLSVGKAFVKTIPFAVVALVFGFLLFMFMEKGLKISIGEQKVLTMAIIQAILGVIVSTLAAYISLKQYSKEVKYTKRKK